MRNLWYGTVLGLACLVGCGRNNAPAPDGARSPLVGKWVAVDGEGMEFRDNGELVLARADKTAVAGKYKVLDAGSVELDLRPAVEEPVQAKVSFTGDELTVTVQRKKDSVFGDDATEEHKSVWKRTAADAPAADDGKKDVDLAGRWVADKETYDFFADGTFAHYIPGDILDEVHLGTWKRSAGALECTYPDSGRTENLIAAASGDGLTLGPDDADHPAPILLSAATFRRDGDAVAERKPVQTGVLTAYQLFQEFKADPDAAEKKYKGKEIQIAGIIRGVAYQSGSLFIKDGHKTVDEDGTVTTLTFSTGEQQNVSCVCPGLEVNIFEEEADGPIHIGAFVVLKGKCQGMGKEEEQGVPGLFEFKIGGDEPKVRFVGCKVVSPTKPEGKKPGGAKEPG